MIDFIGRIASAATHKIHSLPVLVMMPHSGCNCRCVMCDIWKANSIKTEISSETLERHLAAFRKLNVARVALSGGEALMHSNLWKFCDLLHTIGVKISLLSTGISLAMHAEDVVSHCDDLIISLDGNPQVHDVIRNIPKAFAKLEEGVKAIKAVNPHFRVTGRSVLQKQNFKEFFSIIQTARELRLDQVSFLGADVSSEAFNRSDPWTPERISQVSLNEDEVKELRAILERSFVELKQDYDTKFIAEKPRKMLEIVQHYDGLIGKGDFPRKKCNAPWVSAAVESNGDVLPCFFHPSYGNIKEWPFTDIVNSKPAIAFRKNLDVNSDPTCQRCVCSLYLGFTKTV